MSKIYAVLLLVLCSILKVEGQQLQGANWFFGGDYQQQPPTPGTHLNFSGQNPTAAPFNYDFNSMVGVASISDKNGNLLFFSSMGHVSTRQKVNNRYQRMPNGDVFKIKDHNTHAELILQDPVNDSVYYIFFVTHWARPSLHDFYVAKVDMRLNNGFGDVVPNSLQLLQKNVAPGMAAMLHANNRDTWLVTQNAASDSLYSYLIDPSGIASPAISLSYISRGSPVWAMGNYKSSPNSEMLAFRTNDVRAVNLYQFDRKNGAMSMTHTLRTIQGSNCFAFSPDNSKLYVGSAGLTGPISCYIYQFDLAAGTTHQIQQSMHTTVIPSPSNSSMIIDMQLAIDGKIYISRGDSIMYLSRLNCPNLSGAASGFELRASKIVGGSNAQVLLPVLNQTIFRNAGILQAQALQDTICWGDTVQLMAYGAGASQFRWQPANGLSAAAYTLANPKVSPTSTTTYTVTGSGACQTTLTASVTVVVRPKQTEVLKVLGLGKVLPYAKSLVYEIQNPTLGSKYNWMITGGEISSGQGSTKVTVNWFDGPDGKLEVAEINKYSCTGNKTALTVEIDETLQPVFYNIITPNQDQKNDVFEIGNLKLFPENELVIYNRWGVEVYQTNNYQNNWNAEKLSSGVYYYYFRSGGQTWKGWLEVVK